MNVDLPLDGTERHLVRPFSKALYGSEFALEVLVAMAQHERFYGGQLAALTRCENSFASGVLRRYAAAGLIEAAPTEPGQMRKYYRKRPSPLWDSVVPIAESVLASGPSAVSRLPASA